MCTYTFRMKSTESVINKTPGLLLSGTKSSFQIKANLSFHLVSFSFHSRYWRKSGEVQNPYCLKCSVKFPQSVMIWAAMSSAGVGSTVFPEVHSQHRHLPETFRALHASCCWQALWRCRFHFPAGLGTCPHCPKVPKAGSMTMVLLCLIGQQTRLTWTSKRIYGLLSRGRWDTPDPTMQMTWRPLSKQPGLHYTWAVPQADCLHATPHWCSNSCKRSPNQVLSA